MPGLRPNCFAASRSFLRDKDPQAGSGSLPPAPAVFAAPSHLTCAAWALDTAWGTTVPRNAILARNLGQLTESIQSLPRHHYGLFMIDYTNKGLFGQQILRRGGEALGAFHRHQLRAGRHHLRPSC